ncbi:unnamed protein product [Alopecurus aequalis]
MASNQDKASYRAGEAKAHTQAGQATGATKDKACEAKDRASDAAGHATGKGQGAKEATEQKAGEAGNKTSETAQAAKDKASETKQKASEAAQYMQDRTFDAVQNTKEPDVAGKEDKAGGVLSQAGEQVKNVVVGAKDAVANMLGIGGDTTTKDTSAAETITKDHH